MTFDNIMRKFSKKRDFNTVDEFKLTIDELMNELEGEYKISTQKEEFLHKNYEKKLAELDFKASKEAVELGRNQLVKSLEIDTQLEFFKTIKSLIPQIDNNIFKNPDRLLEFRKIANKIIDFKLIRNGANRRILLKHFNKFTLTTGKSSSKSPLDSETANNGIQKIIQEIEETKTQTSSIDDEIDKIIQEIKTKKKK